MVQIWRGGDEILSTGRQLSNLLGGQSAVLGIDVAEPARFAIRQQGLMQWVIATAEPEGENRLLFLARIEKVSGRAERQPYKFRQRKSTRQLLLRLAVSDKAGIETFYRRDEPDLGQ